MNDFATWVRDNRFRCALTQAELAQTVGVSTVQVSKWENSRSICTIHTLKRLCEIFNTGFLLSKHTNLTASK